MTKPNLVILYVSDARRAAAFWCDLLGVATLEASDGFAMLPLAEGVMLGLWTIAEVAPAASVLGGGAEIAIAVATPADVDATHADWAARGRVVLQPPVDLDFGRTFTAADPDGHRIRVYCPGE